MLIGFISVALISSSALAQDFDNPDQGKKKKRERKTYQLEDQRQVREIERGWYAKSNVGGAFYLSSFGQWVRPGSLLGMTVGQDFVDREKMSVAWEAGLVQGVHNGIYPDQQYAGGCVDFGNCIQGDSRTYLFHATAEYSRYSSLRVGWGLRAGGGLMAIPLNMQEDAYISDVVDQYWDSNVAIVHEGVKAVGIGGLTFEYYTKLSHFSVGIDADFMFVTGVNAPGGNVSGYMKYTF
ncbi:MAG: hypothetical protein CMK59_14615 [Proteobacteria bacterium]|nr:hypothetical protein [Pseudomonadota bacterium]